jgi:hypothetical protein
MIKTVDVVVHAAFSSGWKTPNVLPSESTKYPCQQIWGTANFASATIPPAASILFVRASKSATSNEQTKAFVPDCGAGAFRRALQQPSPRASRFNAPICNRQTLDLLKGPSENACVELDGPIRIIRLNFKINCSRLHVFPPFPISAILFLV